MKMFSMLVTVAVLVAPLSANAADCKEGSEQILGVTYTRTCHSVLLLPGEFVQKRYEKGRVVRMQIEENKNLPTLPPNAQILQIPPAVERKQ